VRQRVPTALQERIDARNVKLLQQSIERVADDFVRCIRRLTIAHASEDDEHDMPHSSLQDALHAAERIRTEGGMPRARMYLLLRCWRLHVPWLPEELSPIAVPPDFRMHYGSTAKKMLLDVLIKRGQHDVASLIVAGTPHSEAFVPREMEEWFVSHDHS